MKACEPKVIFRPVRLILLLIIALSGMRLAAQDLPENDPNAEYGLVYFLRGYQITIWNEAYMALIDDERVCKLNNRSYSAHRVTPGIHEFKGQFKGKKGKKRAEIVSIDIEAGKTYYINLVIHTNFWYADLTPREITRNSALRQVRDDKMILDTDCGETGFDFY